MLKRGLRLCLVAVLLIGLFTVLPVAAQAASDMVASEECLAIIKEFEGFSPTAYRDSDGLYTIGYGTRCPTEMVEYYQVYPMTEEEADAELRRCVVDYEVAVNKFIDKHGISFTQGQFDGVISMVYNCGASWLTKGNTLINALTSGATGNELIQAFTIYSMSGGVRSVGHINRRLAEANMYLNSEYQRKPPENYCYVLYNVNCDGGKLSGSNVQGYDANLTATPLITATYEGYEFLGWYTAAKGGEKVTVLDASTDGIKLYAHWVEKLDESETVMPTEPTGPAESETPDEEPETSAVVVTVTGSSVRIRSGPGTSFSQVTSVVRGDKVSITEIKEAEGYVWGRCELGWLALKYTDYDEVGRMAAQSSEIATDP